MDADTVAKRTTMLYSGCWHSPKRTTMLYAGCWHSRKTNYSALLWMLTQSQNEPQCSIMDADTVAKRTTMLYSGCWHSRKTNHNAIFWMLTQLQNEPRNYIMDADTVAKRTTDLYSECWHSRKTNHIAIFWMLTVAKRTTKQRVSAARSAKEYGRLFVGDHKHGLIPSKCILQGVSLHQRDVRSGYQVRLGYWLLVAV
jgi:hypothetical protein